MRMLKLPFLALLLLVGMGLASPAQATLVARLGGQAVYDTDRNITWLANANVIGRVNWQTAKDWAAGLNVGGVTGWRLPTALNTDLTGPCWGRNCTGSELGHLYYTVGGLTFGPGQNITSSAYLSSFVSNMQNGLYWSGTEVAPNPRFAWLFDANIGIQMSLHKGYSSFAWAVRDGDVGVPAVPEPEQ